MSKCWHVPESVFIHLLPSIFIFVKHHQFFFSLWSLYFQPALFPQCSLSHICSFQKYVEPKHFILSPLLLSGPSLISCLDYSNNSQLICLLSTSLCSQLYAVQHHSDPFKYHQTHVLCVLGIFHVFSLSHRPKTKILILSFKVLGDLGYCFFSDSISYQCHPMLHPCSLPWS